MAFDFDLYLNAPVAAIYGDAVSYQPKVKNQVAFILPSGGIFDEAAKTIEFDNGVPLTAVHPIMGVRAADFPLYPAQPAQGDMVTVTPLSGIPNTFNISDVRDDSHGWIYLILEQTQGGT